MIVYIYSTQYVNMHATIESFKNNHKDLHLMTEIWLKS